MLAPNARVICDGVEGMIPATEVVPGDLIILSLGDRIPDDLQVIKPTNMACQKAALTRESVPIDKATNVINVAAGENADQTPLGDKANMCFSDVLLCDANCSRFWTRYCCHNWRFHTAWNDQSSRFAD